MAKLNDDMYHPGLDKDSEFINALSVVGGRLLIYSLPDLSTIDCANCDEEFASHTVLLVISVAEVAMAHYCENCLEIVKSIGAKGTPAVIFH